MFIWPGAIRLVREGEREAGVGVQRGVVPSCRRGRARRRGRGARVTMSWSSGVDRSRAPAEPQRQVQRRACRGRPSRRSLPQKRAWRFQLIGLARSRSLECRKACSDLDHLARARRCGSCRRRAGRRGSTASRSSSARRRRPPRSPSTIRAAGGEVDAERLLAQEVLAGGDRVEVELLVQVVRDREVEDVEVVGPRAAGGSRSCRRRTLRCGRTSASASGLVSHTASARGATGWSSSAAQRPIAAASSRPIRPPPTMPIAGDAHCSVASACVRGVRRRAPPPCSAAVIAARVRRAG